MSIRFERRVAQLGDVQISYIVAGSGPPLLFLHGFPDHAYGWRRQIEALSRDFLVLAPDLRGIGASSAPAGVDHYRLNHLVADVLGVMAAEGLNQASVVGHDWGATIAWWLAIRLPQALRHLVILSTPHPRHYLDAFTDPANVEMLEYIHGFRAPGAAAGLDIDKLSAWVSDAADRDALRATLNQSNLECMLNYYRANLPATHMVDLGPLPFVRAPTLVIYGKQDPFVPVSAFQYTHLELDVVGSVIAIPDAGHFIHHECADFVSSQIRDWVSRPPNYYRARQTGDG